MSLEMIGSRILAPSFGTSVYVWGALISVVMTALTCGYFLGGRAADRWPYLSAMGIILAVAGAAIGFLPLWMGRLTRSLQTLSPRTGSLAAAFALFFLPSLLLAMISPYGIKLAGRSLGHLGGTAGKMAALSSAGSILGTLATSFFLIPALGVRSIARLLGLLLLVLAGMSFLPAKERGKSRGLPLLLLLLCGAMIALVPSPPSGGCLPGMARVLYERDTLYHHLVVDQLGEERHLHFDRSWQSAMDLREPLRMVFAYTSALHLGIVACPQPRRALFIGLGAGSAPRRFLHDYPSLEKVDVVEIDPEVVAVARRYFRLPSDPRLAIFVEDGRLFVARKAEEIRAGRAAPYDLAVLDAFFSDAIPYHLTTREFLLSLHAVLAEDGVAVANLIGAPAGPASGFVRAMARTFAAVFPEVYLFPLGFRTEVPTNVILVAPRQRLGWDAETWYAEAAKREAEGTIREPVSAYATMLLIESWAQRPERLRDVPLLTDDFAPVDTLQSPF
ncbi:MAG: spermidine synthase [Bacillota bacterium]